MEFLEGVTSSFGEEFARAVGIVQSKLTVAVTGPTQIPIPTMDPPITSSSGDGFNVTFSAPISISGTTVFRLTSFNPLAVLLTGTGSVFPNLMHRTIQCPPVSTSSMHPGQVIKITTGVLSGQSGLVDQIISDHEFTIENPGFTGGDTGFTFTLHETLQRREALIDSTGPSSAVLHGDGVGAMFSTEQFVLEHPGSTSLELESALDFPDSGVVAISGRLYAYRSKFIGVVGPAVVHQLRGVYPLSFLPFESTVLVPDVAGLTNHSTIEIYTGAIPDLDAEPMYQGATSGVQILTDRGVSRIKSTRNFVTFEFLIDESSALTSINHIPVRVRTGWTQAQVAAEFARSVGLARLNVQAYVLGTVVRLRDRRPGGVGRYSMRTSSVAIDLGWGAADVQVGIDQAFHVGTVVTDWTKVFSALDRLRASFFLRTATGHDLSVVASNGAVNRPVLLEDDEEFRRIVQAFMFARKTSMLAVREVLEGMLGPEGYEVIELMMYGSTAPDQNPYATQDPTNTPAIPGSYVDTGRVAVRRRLPGELEAFGKTYLQGALHARMTSSTTVVIEAPNRLQTVIGLRLANDPQKPILDHTSRSIPLYERGRHRSRLASYFRSSIGLAIYATSTDGVTVTFSSSITASFKIGDIFIPLAGAFDGISSVITEILSTTSIKVGQQRGLSLAAIGFPGAFSAVGWEVRRDISNNRFYVPTADTYLEVTTAPSPTTTAIVTPWALDSGTQTAMPGGTQTAAPATPTQWSHALPRYRALESGTRLSVLVDLSSITAAVSGNIFTLQLDQGSGLPIAILGINYLGGGQYEVGFHDTTGFLAVQTVYEGSTFPSSGILRLELVSEGDLYLAYVDGKLVASTRTLTGSGAAPQMLIRYANAPVTAGTPPTTPVFVLEIDWEIGNPADYWNRNLTGTLSTVSTDRLHHSTYTFVAGDIGKRILVTEQAQPVAIIPERSARGEWIIAAVIGGNAQVYGPKQNGLRFLAGQQYVVEASGMEFVWPDIQGHSIEILSGPNAGFYLIDRVLDPDTLTPIDTKYPTLSQISHSVTTADWKVPLRWSNRIRLLDPLPNPATTETAAWRISPDWMTGKTLVGQLVDAGTVTGTGPWTLTLPSGLTAGDLVEIQMDSVGTGFVETDLPLEIGAGSGLTGVTSLDGGETILFQASTLTTVTSRIQGPAIRPGDRIQVFGVEGGTSAPLLVIQVGPGQQVKVSPPVGANFSMARWTLTAGPVNMDVTGRLLEPFYLMDQWSYRADFLDADLLAAGFSMDFDHLLRDQIYPYPDLRGLRLVD